jgi:hypothetical protein
MLLINVSLVSFPRKRESRRSMKSIFLDPRFRGDDTEKQLGYSLESGNLGS